MKATITDITEFQTKGFVTLGYPEDLRAAVVRVADSWKAFCALPTEIKKSVPYSNNADGVGYEIKDGIGVNVDHKENFDMTISGVEWLAAHAAEVTDPTVLQFAKDMASLVPVLKPTVVEFARQLETAFGLDGITDEVEQNEDVFFIRFIHYFSGQKKDEVTAAAHVDNGGFTPHLFESAPGLQCLSYDGVWTDMPVSGGETVIIPGMQMQHRSGGELKALCHRVIETGESLGGRYSAVCFVQLKKSPKYDKDTFGRQQGMKPGYNYTIPYEEFIKLFKE